ncbi:IS110 family transposase [Methylobacterium terricola]|uniref:IS110 family transposase n=1 Tax=Methylobacterium terricola TaxID=2583531 RepID=A0A5C4LEV6_9HYPH|nr:IS110 family transposase [Methylobacterium terricola]TNC12339.1 IS110 family transposase [Methylobacterium terricola]
MTQVDDLSRSFVPFDQNRTLVAVLEMSQSRWLAAAVVPGISQRPLKKLEPDPVALLGWLGKWREKAGASGQFVDRVVLVYEAGRDGFWLARWLKAHGVEAFVVHSTSVAVSREHRRAKTDRLDTEMLIRVFLGWLRGEPRHCKMVAVPTVEEEDAKRPSRERENLVGEQTRIINRMKAALIRLGLRSFKPDRTKASAQLEELRTPEGILVPPNMLAELKRDMARLAWVREQIAAIEKSRLERLEQTPADEAQAKVQLLTRIVGMGVETADMLVREVLCRNLRDRRAVARYAGVTGSPDESGTKRRERGLAKAGNARVRRGLMQFAWRFLRFQPESALATWYRERTEGGGKRKTTMIVALARKLLIALWRLVMSGEVPQGVQLRPIAA